MTALCLILKSFQYTSCIKQLWETAYFMYKLQNFNQQIQYKTISQVLFKYFIKKARSSYQKALIYFKYLKVNPIYFHSQVWDKFW